MKTNVLFLILFLTTIYSQNKNMENYQYDRELLNEKGQRHGTLVSTSYLFDGLAYSHIYENGVLMQTTDSRFQIGNEKELVGKYKEGMPNEGYFVYENEFEIPEIDYYEKGVFQTKFTTTIMAILEVEMTGIKPKMIKSIYKDQKLWQGLNHKSYRMHGSSLVATEYYENGAIESVDLWILAMHYAELIKIKFLPSGYEIYVDGKNDPEGDPQQNREPASISVQFIDEDNGNVIFSVDNKLVAKHQFSLQSISSKVDWVQKMIIYSFTDDDTILLTNKFNFEAGDEAIEQNSSFEQNILTKFYTQLVYKPIVMLNAKKENDYLKIFDFNENTMEKTFLIVNTDGKPFVGTLIEYEAGKYRYSKYENSKIIATKNKLSLQDVKKILGEE